MDHDEKSKTTESAVAIDNLAIKWNRDRPSIIEGLSLCLSAGECIAVMGPSGVGKSTLLGAIGGTTRMHAGQIRIPIDVNYAGSSCGMIFQEPWLYPWMNIQKNVAFVLRRLYRVRKARLEVAAEALRDVGLHGHEYKYPWQLSRGMAQRVAFARCFVTKPKLILADEPFASLDSFMKRECVELFTRLRIASRAAAIIATHDVHEAVNIADRICVLAGSPASIVYESSTIAAKTDSSAFADLSDSIQEQGNRTSELCQIEPSGEFLLKSLQTKKMPTSRITP